MNSKPVKCNHHCNKKDINKICIVLSLITIFFCVEMWGHFRTKSLSLLADALHLFVDISGFVVSIATLKMAHKKSNSKMTFGYLRYEIIGALFSVFFIWAAVGYLIMESIHKYLHPKSIDGRRFLQIAIAGLIVNLICIVVLHHNNKSANLNMKATYVHVLGDIIQSVGVIIASAIIYKYPKFIIADVICTVFFAILVFISTFSVVREAVEILSESAPKGINQDQIKTRILELDGVLKVTDLKVWSVSASSFSISVKILTDHILIKDYEKILKSVKSYLEDELNIFFVNVQIDTPATNEEKIGLEIDGVNFREVI